MNSLPPGLLYLIIYNPKLKPVGPIDPDDEDAEEQAHVLFYTANDHAASRDRVLRQVGLAQAVVNFSAMFDAHSPCDAVHSLSRRMLTVSPEPDYWIHACIELAKLPRPVKKGDKNIGKQQAPVYDHMEASLHDTSLREQILQAYDKFKISYGSFTSILSKEGREALELQMERFFTVWAWSWDLSNRPPFSDFLGFRIHPLSSQLIPLIQSIDIPEQFEALVLAAPCIITSRSSSADYPPSLMAFLLSIVERSQAQASRNTQAADKLSSATASPVKTSESSADSAADTNKKPDKARSSTGSMRFPGVKQLNASMDIRNWGWPGYLTFGANKSHTSTSTTPSVCEPLDSDTKTNNVEKLAEEENDLSAESEHIEDTNALDSTVDSVALKDALSSEGTPVQAIPSFNSVPDRTTDPPHMLQTDAQSTSAAVEGSNSSDLPTNEAEPVGPSTVDEQVKTMDGVAPEGTIVPAELDPAVLSLMVDDSEATLPSDPSPEFRTVYVHLPGQDAVTTYRRSLRYMQDATLLFAIVPKPEYVDAQGLDDGQGDLTSLAGDLANVLKSIRQIIDAEEGKISAAMSSAPVQSVLQKSQHVIALPNQLTYASPTFSCTSWHMHAGRRALELEPEVLEIYSRGQSPQDWHLVKRGAQADMCAFGDVYMEIGRKEASLIDVDNEVAALLRRLSE